MAEAIGGVVKVIELVGSSPASFDEAIRTAVRTAAVSLRNIKGLEVISQSASIEGSDIVNFKATCKIAFVVDTNAGE